jgi:ribosomal-protein-alanine N-acetyltransferase
LSIEDSSYRDPWDKCDFMDAISDSMPHSHLWVAIARAHPYNADSLMGYICFHWLKDELYIIKLTTSPIHRKKGVASCLLGLAVLWAKRRNGKRVILDVDIENIPARNLYKRFGFRKIGPSGKKAWIMELGLDHYQGATTLT